MKHNTFSRSRRFTRVIVSYMPIALAAWRLTVFAAGPEPIAAGDGELRSDPYRQLAEALAAQVQQPVMNIGVGNFLFGANEQMSGYSALLREELETALARTGKFKVITRSRLADLQNEGKFQKLAILDPATPVRDVKIEGVEGLVRGNFYYRYPDVTVFAELAWLEGGAVRKAKEVVPVAAIGAKLWPDMPAASDAGKLGAFLIPDNFAAGVSNVADVTARIRQVPHDFTLDLTVVECKRDFAEGEKIRYRVTAYEACHLAVFCHQVDGSTVVLFPNAWCADTAVPAKRRVEIPGAVKKGFEIVIRPPFGADVVQVIACTRKSALHAMIQDYVAAAEPGVVYRGIPRGMVAQGVADALAETAPAGSSPSRWSEAHLVVSTYPRY